MKDLFFVNDGMVTIRTTEAIIKAAEDKIRQLEVDITSLGHPTISESIQLGSMSNPLTSVIQKTLSIKIEGKGLYTSTAALLHHRGGQKKARGKEVSFKDLITLPSRVSCMDIYAKDGLIFFTDYKNKYMVRLNQPIKMPNGNKKIANHISSSKIIDEKEFNNGYLKIKKTR